MSEYKTHIIDHDSPTPIECNPHDGKNIYQTPVKMRSGNGKVMQSDMLDYIRRPRRAVECHSDGFLAISHTDTPPAYSCQNCGFQGIFSRSACIRCNTPTRTKRKRL